MRTEAVIALAAAALLSGCSLVLDFSERVDAAPEFNPRCDVAEPNDEAALAQPTDAPQNAALCGASDVDFFILAVGPSDDVLIEVTGDADFNPSLELLKETDLLTVDSSDGPGSTESIRRALDEGNQLAEGTYLIELKGSSQASGSKEGNYVLTVTVESLPLPDAGTVDAPAI